MLSGPLPNLLPTGSLDSSAPAKHKHTGVRDIYYMEGRESCGLFMCYQGFHLLTNWSNQAELKKKNIKHL